MKNDSRLKSGHDCQRPNIETWYDLMRQTIRHQLLQLGLFLPLANVVGDYVLVRGYVDVRCSGAFCHLLARIFTSLRSFAQVVPMFYSVHGLRIRCFSNDKCSLVDFFLPHTLFDSYYCDAGLEASSVAVNASYWARCCEDVLEPGVEAMDWYWTDDQHFNLTISSYVGNVQVQYREELVLGNTKKRNVPDLIGQATASISLGLNDLVHAVNSLHRFSADGRVLLEWTRDKGLKLTCGHTVIMLCANANPKGLINQDEGVDKVESHIGVHELKRVVQIIKKLAVPYVMCFFVHPEVLMLEHSLAHTGRARYVLGTVPEDD